jgi:hypothetical protein
VKLDHVVFAVGDLAAAARELESRHGLVSIAGGRHPGWGTENRIVPLGESYLELIAVADEAEAAASRFGGWVAAARGARPQPLGWAVRTDELDRFARRLGLLVAEGSRETADGSVLRWRYAGVERARAEPCLPFFIEWAAESTLPGYAGAVHFGVAELQLEGDAEELRDWLGAHDVPLAVRPGEPAVTAVVLRGPRGPLVLSGGS